MDQKLQATYRVLRESGSPLSTNDVADRLDVDWHTAKKRLDALLERGEIHRKEWRSNLTLWWDREIPL